MTSRARALVGTRFRPQGRNAEHGIDCLGLVAIAADIPPELVPSGYTLRSEVGEEMRSSTFAERVAPVPVCEAGAGDVLLVRAGAGQHHFLILLEKSFVHADARLGRVVETPGRVRWPALAAWRVLERD